MKIEYSPQFPELTEEEAAAAYKSRLDMQNLHAIEGNPFDDEDIALFEMFEHERWNHKDRHAYIMLWAEKIAATSRNKS